MGITGRHKVVVRKLELVQVAGDQLRRHVIAGTEPVHDDSGPAFETPSPRLVRPGGGSRRRAKCWQSNRQHKLAEVDSDLLEPAISRRTVDQDRVVEATQQRDQELQPLAVENSVIDGEQFAAGRMPDGQANQLLPHADRVPRQVVREGGRIEAKSLRQSARLEKADRSRPPRLIAILYEPLRCEQHADVEAEAGRATARFESV